MITTGLGEGQHESESSQGWVSVCIRKEFGVCIEMRGDENEDERAAAHSDCRMLRPA